MKKLLFFIILLFVATLSSSETLKLKSEKVTESEIIRQTFPDAYQPTRIVYKFSKDGKKMAMQEVSLKKDNPYPEVIKTEGEIPDGIVKEYYSSGQLLGEYTYKNNKEHGLTKTYHHTGSLKSEALLEDGLLKTLKVYSENGHLIQKFEYDKGIIIKAELYYSNGNIKSEFHPGETGNIFRVYCENGVLAHESNISEYGKLEGLELAYDCNGNL